MTTLDVIKLREQAPASPLSQEGRQFNPDEGFSPLTWRYAVQRCLRSGKPFNDKERVFLADLLDFERPTEKQMKWLRSLHRRAAAFSSQNRHCGRAA